LTGYCADDSLIEPIIEYLKKPNMELSYAELMDNCVYNWAKMSQKDYDFSISEEFFIEECEANEWEFDEDGNVQ
jgi:hypothetical protein